MTIGEIMEYDCGIASLLMKSGMYGADCPSSVGEPLEHACVIHELKVDNVLRSVTEYISDKNENQNI